jgi:hypothetical protein
MVFILYYESPKTPRGVRTDILKIYPLKKRYLILHTYEPLDKSLLNIYPLSCQDELLHCVRYLDGNGYEADGMLQVI